MCKYIFISLFFLYNYTDILSLSSFLLFEKRSCPQQYKQLLSPLTLLTDLHSAFRTNIVSHRIWTVLCNTDIDHFSSTFWTFHNLSSFLLYKTMRYNTPFKPCFNHNKTSFAYFLFEPPSCFSL